MGNYFDDVDERLANGGRNYKTFRLAGTTQRRIDKGKCSGCNKRLRYRDGMTTCIDCLAEEAHKKAEGD